MTNIEIVKIRLLNEEQKAVNKKIMEDLIEALFGNLKSNADVFNNQSLSDCVITCLITFTTHVIGMWIAGHELKINVHADMIEKTIDKIFETIKTLILADLKNYCGREH